MKKNNYTVSLIPTIVILILGLISVTKANEGNRQEAQWREWLKANPPTPGSVVLKPEKCFPEEGGEAASLLWEARRLFGGEGILSVVNQRESRILKFDLNGKYLGSFGRQGQGPGEYSLIRRVVHLSGGYVVFDTSGRITELDRSGEILSSAIISQPSWDLVPGQGKRYFAALSAFPGMRHLVMIIDEKGKKESSFALPPDIHVTNELWWKVLLDSNLRGECYVAFEYWPILRKYSPNGEIIFEKRLSDPLLVQKEKMNLERIAKTKGPERPGFVGIINAIQSGKNGVYLFLIGPRLEILWIADSGVQKRYFVERERFEESYSSFWVDERESNPVFYIMMNSPENKICVFR